MPKRNTKIAQAAWCERGRPNARDRRQAPAARTSASIVTARNDGQDVASISSHGGSEAAGLVDERDKEPLGDRKKGGRRERGEQER